MSSTADDSVATFASNQRFDAQLRIAAARHWSSHSSYHALNVALEPSESSSGRIPVYSLLRSSQSSPERGPVTTNQMRRAQPWWKWELLRSSILNPNRPFQTRPSTGSTLPHFSQAGRKGAYWRRRSMLPQTGTASKDHRRGRRSPSNLEPRSRHRGFPARKRRSTDPLRRFRSGQGSPCSRTVSGLSGPVQMLLLCPLQLLGSA